MSSLDKTLNILRKYDQPTTADKKLSSIVLKQIRNNINNLPILLAEYINLFIRYYTPKKRSFLISTTNKIVALNVDHFTQTNLYSVYIDQLLHKSIIFKNCYGIYILELTDKFKSKVELDLKIRYPYDDNELNEISMVLNRKQVPTDVIYIIKNFLSN